MTTGFPSAIDTTATLKNDAVDATVTSITHEVAHNNVADSIIAVETELGTNPKGTYADVKTRLNDGVIKTPAGAQVIRASADIVPFAVRKNTGTDISNLSEWRDHLNVIFAFLDTNGNFSAQALKIAGTLLASTHLSDSALLARLASPTFTGTPTAPTAAAGTSTTQIATTAFVTANSTPTGVMVPFAGYTAPNGWAKATGQAVARTGGTYDALLTAITFVQNGTLTSGSASITGLTDTSDMRVGTPLEGTGIPAAATVLTIVSGTAITISANATANGSQSLRFFPYGNGNGTTTFNLPDPQGRVIAGQSGAGGHTDMLGVGANEGVALGTRRMKHAHGLGNLTITHTLAISGGSHAHSVSISNRDSGGSLPADWGLFDANVSTSGASTFGTTGNTHTHPTGEFSGAISPSGGVGTVTSAPTESAAYLVMPHIIKL